MKNIPLSSLANQIVGVQPMGGPAGQIFKMNRQQQHPDFHTPNGKLSSPTNIKKHFPPHKRDSFFNYIKLFHSDRFLRFLVHYAIHVQEKRWPEIEKYLEKNEGYKTTYMKKFNLTEEDLNK